MTHTALPNRSWPDDTRVLLALSLLVPALHVLAALSPHYGYFIDELYYIACSKRLAWGYVDHPPLAPLLLAGTRLILGESVLAIRLLAFLAAGATVFLTGVLTRELGGGRFAVVLAAASMGLAPGLLAMTGFFSMNAFEPLFWTGTLYALVRLARSGNSKLWLVVGMLLGFGFENKHTSAAFACALGVGILVTPLRRSLRDPWLWGGAAVTLGLVLPNAIWQAIHGWPSLEFYRAAHELKNVPSPPLRSIASQVLIMNPVTLPVWLAGLGFLLLGRETKDVRFLGWTYIVLLAMQVASGTSRADRILGIYPVLVAAGAAVVSRWVRPTWARVALTGAVAASSLALVPVVLPVLTPPTLARYVAALGLTNDVERGKSSPIPQLLADRTGWESFLDDMVRVYGELPQEERARAAIYVPDYGHAGAIELWRARSGLPNVFSGHNSYFLWSVGQPDPEVLIAVGLDPSVFEKLFRDVRRVGTVRCDYCMSWRANMPIYLARDPIVPLHEVWQEFKHYE